MVFLTVAGGAASDTRFIKTSIFGAPWEGNSTASYWSSSTLITSINADYSLAFRALTRLVTHDPSLWTSRVSTETRTGEGYIPLEGPRQWLDWAIYNHAILLSEFFEFITLHSSYFFSSYAFLTFVYGWVRRLTSSVDLAIGLTATFFVLSDLAAAYLSRFTTGLSLILFMIK